MACVGCGATAPHAIGKPVEESFSPYVAASAAHFNYQRLFLENTFATPQPVVVPIAKTKPIVRSGHSLPASIIECESGGSYTAENPTSTASGKYQIVDGTWDGYGGYSHASDAPPHVQDARAAQIWNGGKGKNHWRQCL